MGEHTGTSYEEIAGNYAQKVDSKPIHLHYERPAVLSLLPPLANKKVLDVGCGSGWYAEQFVQHGALVTAFDLNAQFVALTQARVGAKATVLQADLAQPLTFAQDGEFDLIVCPLVMHYLKAWQPPLSEFQRILKPDGVLVFSTHHPFMDWQQFAQENYFALTLLEDEWQDIGKVRFYRRPLTMIFDDLYKTGFVIERLLEPQPQPAYQPFNPTWYERLQKNPWFLVIRAIKRE